MPSPAAFLRYAAAGFTLGRAQLTRAGRAMTAEIQALQAAMPARYEALALPDFLAWLTPQRADWAGRSEEAVRELVDALALLDHSSPFGLCLRRSLLRYHFLRRVGLPVGIVFAMRKRQTHEPSGLAGHAWNILDGEPYHEREENMRGFTEVYRWPPETWQ